MGDNKSCGERGMTASTAASLKTQLSRWENGHVVPVYYRPLLRELFGLTAREFDSVQKLRHPADASLNDVSEPGPVTYVSPAISELCGALTDYGFNMGRLGSTGHGEVPPLRDLERGLNITFAAYQQSRFTAAASRVSMLLADAQLAARECKETERSRILSVLALSYQCEVR
jgi:hypothetical protein